jgi:hypothetical protein
VFYGCQKNLERLDPSVSAQSTANPLTVQMAQTWFESKYGKSKTISYPRSQTNTSSLNGDATHDDFYFNETFQITPTWSDAKISTYLSVHPIVIVPIKSIPFLDVKNQEYVFVCFRNELNQIDGRLQVYQPTFSYKKSHSKYDVRDFSGFMLQICLNGKVQKVFGYENGKFKLNVKLKANTNLGGGNLNVRGNCPGCFTDDPTSSWWHDLKCWFCGLGGDNTITDGSGGGGSTDASLGFSNQETTTTNTTTTTGGTGSYDNSGPIAGTGSTAGLYNQSDLSNQVDNTLFGVNGTVDQAAVNKANAQSRYLNAGFNLQEFDLLWADDVLFAQVDGFFDSNQHDVDVMKSFKDGFSLTENEFEPESWGYPVNHPVTQAIKGFNNYIWRAFVGSNNFSTKTFHKHTRGEGGADALGKSIGAIGEGIFAKRLNDAAGFSTFIAQNSRMGGYQHDILQRTVCFKATLDPESYFTLKVNYTDGDGGNRATEVYTYKDKNSRFSVGKISYEVKTVDESSSVYNLKSAFEVGVTQVKDRALVNGIDAGILVFDLDAYQIIKNHPDVIAALSDLESVRNSLGHQKAFLRLEPNLRYEAGRAYYALKDLIKNIQP